jgi:hypothetical protein
VLTCTRGGDGGACLEARAIEAELDRHQVGGLAPNPITPGYRRALDRLTAHEVHDWTRYDPDQQTYEKWEALPLIVLAGLK